MPFVIPPLNMSDVLKMFCTYRLTQSEEKYHLAKTTWQFGIYYICNNVKYKYLYIFYNYSLLFIEYNNQHWENNQTQSQNTQNLCMAKIHWTFKLRRKLKLSNWNLHSEWKKISHTGNWTRASRVRAGYPNH